MSCKQLELTTDLKFSVMTMSGQQCCEFGRILSRSILYMPVPIVMLAVSHQSALKSSFNILQQNTSLSGTNISCVLFFPHRKYQTFYPLTLPCWYQNSHLCFIFHSSLWAKMSCSSAKSKAAGRRRSVQSTTPGMQEVEVKYVTPAGPTQAQWADMIIQEDAEEAVVEIMEDVMNQVMEGCEKIYLKKQVHLKTKNKSNDQHLTDLTLKQRSAFSFRHKLSAISHHTVNQTNSEAHRSYSYLCPEGNIFHRILGQKSLNTDSGAAIPAQRWRGRTGGSA